MPQVQHAKLPIENAELSRVAIVKSRARKSRSMPSGRATELSRKQHGSTRTICSVPSCDSCSRCCPSPSHLLFEQSRNEVTAADGTECKRVRGASESRLSIIQRSTRCNQNELRTVEQAVRCVALCAIAGTSQERRQRRHTTNAPSSPTFFSNARNETTRREPKTTTCRAPDGNTDAQARRRPTCDG